MKRRSFIKCAAALAASAAIPLPVKAAMGAPIMPMTATEVLGRQTDFVDAFEFAMQSSHKAFARDMARIIQPMLSTPNRKWFSFEVGAEQPKIIGVDHGVADD